MKQPPELRPWLAGMARALPSAVDLRLAENHVGCGSAPIAPFASATTPLLAALRSVSLMDATWMYWPANQLAGRESIEQYATYDWPLCCVCEVSQFASLVELPTVICILTADGRVTMTLPSASFTW